MIYNVGYISNMPNPHGICSCSLAAAREQEQRGSGASVSARAGPELHRRVSVAGRTQRRGLPQAAAEPERIEQTGL